MRRAALLGLMLMATLLPASASGEERAGRPRFVHRSLSVFPCCVASAYFPPEPIVPAPPPIVYVVPSAPSLAYVPPPKVEPAPEITLPTGRWERHGNGREYPYTWVWQPSHSR